MSWPIKRAEVACSAVHTYICSILDDSKEIVEAHPMKGGSEYSQAYFNYLDEASPVKSRDSPTCNAQNSFNQSRVEAAEDVIVKAINENLDIQRPPFCNPFRIADFGCSTGPNTLMQKIVQRVLEKSKQYLEKNINSAESGSSNNYNQEFHVFFNDHIQNDFNILFRSLPAPSKRQYFAAGVPGSFYSRLFPKASLHFVHSSYALHWLSEVPSEVQGKNSPAWNKGKIHYTGTDKEVTKAYFCQFQKDMSAFLKARADELVEGGLMVILLPGIPKGGLFSETGAGMIHSLMGSCLVDMGTETKGLVDSFNLPLYYPSVEELEKLIEMNNCFSIQRSGSLNHPLKLTSEQVEAVMEELITQHFKKDIADRFFQLFTQKLAGFDKEINNDVDLFIVLKRKKND